MPSVSGLSKPAFIGVFKTNKIYDWLIVILIALGALGDMFAPVTLQRLFAILFIPSAAILYVKNHKAIPLYVGLFFIIWIVFSVISLVWSPDRMSGIKAVAYNLCSVAVYLELILFSLKAKNPVRSILSGWTLLFALTLVVALWEIFTNQHLPMNVRDDVSIMSATGHRVWMIYASVTYGNYNTYVLIILYCLPFILASIAYFRRIKIWYWILLVGAIFVLLVNSSRGGVGCLCLMGMVMLMFFAKNRLINRFVFILILASICGGIIYYSDVVLDQVVGRFSNQNVFEDDLREDIYRRGFKILTDSFGIGCGIGGIQVSLEQLSGNEISAMHNMFLEFLAQYGIVPFIAFVIVLFKTIKSLIKSDYTISRFLGYLIALVIIPISLINSTYLLDQNFWTFWASLFVMGHVSEEKQLESEYA